MSYFTNTEAQNINKVFVYIMEFKGSLISRGKSDKLLPILNDTIPYTMTRFQHKHSVSSEYPKD